MPEPLLRYSDPGLNGAHINWKECIMAHTSKPGWTSNAQFREGQNERTTDDFEFNQSGKPIKAVIGVAILVILALVLSRMDPVSHEASAPSSITTAQTAGSSR